MASMTRDSSPPDAPFCSGSDGAPGWASSRSSTSSAPSGPRLRSPARGATATSPFARGLPPGPDRARPRDPAGPLAPGRREALRDLADLALQPLPLLVQLLQQVV